MKSIIFLSSKNQVEKNSNFIKKVRINKIIILDDSLIPIISKYSFSNDTEIVTASQIIDNTISWNACIENATELFDTWNKLQTNNRKIFLEKIGYKGKSLLDLDSCRYLSAHSETIANIIKKIKISESILKNTKPNDVILCEPFTDWERIISGICSRDKILLYRVKNGNIHKNHNICKRTDQLKIEISNHDLKLQLPWFLYSVLYVAYIFVRKNKFKNKLRREKEEKEILFFVLNKKYLDIVIPVIKSIKKDKIKKPLLLISEGFNGTDILIKEKIQFQFIDCYLTNRVILKSFRIYFKILKNFNKIRAENIFRSKIYTFNNINIKNVIEPLIIRTYLFSINSIINTNLIQEIIRKNNSEMLIMPHIAENIVKSFFAGTNIAKKKSIGIKRGTTYKSSELGTFNGDILLVPGQYSKKMFIESGIKKEKIHVTGLPMFDDLINKTKRNEELSKHIRKKISIDKKKSIITYLTQSLGGTFYEKQREIEIRNIFSVLKELDNLFLIIKIHPTEKGTEIYKKLIKEMDISNYAILKRSDLLDDILVASDIALTKHSQTGFNAIIARCKLIVLGFHDNTFSNNFFSQGNVAISVSDKKELKKSITTSLNNKNLIPQSIVDEFIKMHYYKMDGKSADRIKNILYKFLKTET